MDVIFTLYKGFLIAEHSETDVRAYRNQELYAGNTTSYETTSKGYISQMIDEAEDYGYFTDVQYNEVMQLLGRAGQTEPAFVYPKYLHHVMGKVRQHIGLTEFDTSKDEEINNMSHNAVLDHVLEWEGIIGYGGTIRGWVETIYGVTLE